MSRSLSIGLVGLLLFALALPMTVAAQSCFPETDACVEGRFESFWQRNGALPIFGLPTTALLSTTESSPALPAEAQWFERARFEYHPENPAPYQVLLGHLGVERLAQRGVDWQLLPKTDPSVDHYFPETGQAITHDSFWRFWRAHGLDLGDPGISLRESLALFGYPISPLETETNSSGDTVLTQWFERARFEDHGAAGVKLGLLGNEVRAASAALPTPPPADGPADPPAPLPPSYLACQADPNADRAPNYPLQIVALDKQAEVVTLKNVSLTPISLDGWILCSVTGNQEHVGLSGVLEAGQERAFPYTGEGSIWANDARDDAALYNLEGSLVSYWVDR